MKIKCIKHLQANSKYQLLSDSKYSRLDPKESSSNSNLLGLSHQCSSSRTRQDHYQQPRRARYLSKQLPSITQISSKLKGIALKVTRTQLPQLM